MSTELNQIISTSPDNLKNNTENKAYLLTEPTELPQIESKYSKVLRKALRKIEKRKPKDIGSIFEIKKINNKKKRNLETNKTFNNEMYMNYNKDEYNVFSKEDHLVKDLMVKFNEKNAKDKIPKLNRKKIAFNRLYDITDESNAKLLNLKKSKKFYSLPKYQENILKSINTNSIEKSEIMNLIQNLNNIKDEANKVQALPPINIDMIKSHIINNNKKETKKKNMKEIMSNNVENLDEYEKEEKMIRNNNKKFKSQSKFKKNKNFDMLPEYIREIFTKKLNYHN
jgi:hypothetical protein